MGTANDPPVGAEPPAVRMSRATTRSSRWWRLAAAAALLVALTGCTRAEMNLTIADDGTVSGAIVMAVSEGLLKPESGQSISDAADGYFETLDDDPTADVPGTIDIVEYREDGYIGRQANLENVPAEELEERFAAYDLSITADDGTFTFGMAIDLTEHPQMGDDTRADMQLTVSVTMPGKITDTNGEASGGTVTWTLDATVANELTATATPAPTPTAESGDAAPDDAATVGGGDTGTVARIVAASAVVLVLIAIGTVLFTHRRRQRRQTPAILTSVDMQATQEIPVIRPDGPPPR